jgi:hypothetical protein
MRDKRHLGVLAFVARAHDDKLVACDPARNAREIQRK